MVTDAQVRRLMKLMQKEDTLALAAAKAGMDEVDLSSRVTPSLVLGSQSHALFTEVNCIEKNRKGLRIRVRFLHPTSKRPTMSCWIFSAV